MVFGVWFLFNGFFPLRKRNSTFKRFYGFWVQRFSAPRNFRPLHFQSNIMTVTESRQMPESGDNNTHGIIAGYLTIGCWLMGVYFLLDHSGVKFNNVIYLMGLVALTDIVCSVLIISHLKWGDISRAGRKRDLTFSYIIGIILMVLGLFLVIVRFVLGLKFFSLIFP